jgi:hypothetical protein
MPSIVQAINDFKFEASQNDVLEFLKKREAIRLAKELGIPQPWTNDEILAKSKFLNVFREHDAVSKIIFKHAPKGDLIYPYVYLARLVNHRKHIPWLFSSHDWLSNLDSIKNKMIDFVNKGDTVCNPGAYQINPRIGFKYGHRNIRDSLKYVIPARLEHVVNALKSTDKINEATVRANNAFGGFSNFWMFQSALDIAWLRPDLMDRNSKPYFGSGSKQVESFDSKIMLNYLNKNKPNNWRNFYPFDVENALCEFRKYKMRQTKGIPNNRKYKKQ